MDPGLYRHFQPIPGKPRPAVFLDRDGVVVEEVGYLHKPEDVRFLPGALDAIAAFNRAGMLVILVTNQAGIARGYYGWDEFLEVQAVIEAAAHFDGVWACAYHDSGRAPYAHTDHPFRKPNPGMILDALAALPVDPSASWLIGDKVCDLEAAIRGGLGRSIHVRTGHGPEHRPRVAALAARFPDARIHTAESIAEAATLILNSPETL